MNKKHLIFFLLFCLLLVLIGWLWLVFHLQNRLNRSLQKGWFQAPVEFYTSAETITVGMALSPKDFKKKLKQRYIPYQVDFKNPAPNPSSSHKNSPKKQTDSLKHSLKKQAPGSLSQQAKDLKKTELKGVSWEDPETKNNLTVYFQNQKAHTIYQNQKEVEQIILNPFLFAQYEKGQAILKKFTPLPEVPFHCRMADLAAEDHSFITHGGISFKAILRAIYKNLKAGHLKEGASTITQQLVKNIFFARLLHVL